MTRMLVRVASAEEAADANAAGVDAVELIVGSDLDLTIAKAVRHAFHGTLRLRFEDAGLEPDLLAASVKSYADEIHADEIALPPAQFDTSLPPGPTYVAIVAIVANPDMLDAIPRLRDKVSVLMLDMSPMRLIDCVDIATLDAFASTCRATGRPFGLAGGLESPDVARLLLLEPDVLGFDVAVRRNHCQDAPLDPRALDAMRALIPRAAGGVPRQTGREPIEMVTDCVFVRDFAISLAIGAYQAELGTRQRVRFSVDADVVRRPLPPHDMRDVFSYDVIIETIRVLSQRPHVSFVETLAEEVATALLAHAALIAVKVKVEKLDVIDGSVGIEITRRRPA